MAAWVSFGKAIALQKFVQNLDLKKSQIDAMLNQLSRVREKEFKSLLIKRLSGRAMISIHAFLREEIK